MKNVWYIFLVIILCSCIKEQEEELPVSYLHVGDYLPVFSALSVADSLEAFDSDVLKGKVSMIVLFTSECSDCRRELPKIESVCKELETDENFIFASFAREQNKNAIIDYWSRSGFTMPVYFDSDRAIFNLFAKNTVPRIYIADRDQKIVWIGVNEITSTVGELVAMVKGLE